MHPLERLLFATAGLMLIDPGTITDVAGLGLLGAGLVFQWRKKRMLDASSRAFA
jgi:UPF0716 family protein affecting phage T7 exclusion